ncbi:hypothetical protein NU688_26650 [Variovorax sp. ZS18.2.2]|uniref:hypothetical protein n=1 Tax=Variovorax sp. ZS18.2.2 TaxID=2971255 RepID=UPI00215181AE|nr:hypothetical protein [Variovorax sp. ZS18.2.2]MCR6479764.1 hypothetical protein [Variovorax sp. ZS18.2.2]
MYLLHKRYATDPRHYIRAFLLIEEEILNLFTYVEPSDINSNTYSHKIQQLLMRTCVEIEANFTAILLENNYAEAKKGNTNIKHYRLIDKSHRLSAFEVRVPTWKGSNSVRSPFQAWASSSPLSWYQAYNKSKHQRHENFERATFDALMDAFCGLNILLSAQFCDEEYSPRAKSIGLSGAAYHYDGEDGMEPSIGSILRIKFPTDWPDEQRYEFKWPEISLLADPFQDYDYAQHPIT